MVRIQWMSRTVSYQFYHCVCVCVNLWQFSRIECVCVCVSERCVCVASWSAVYMCKCFEAIRKSESSSVAKQSEFSFFTRYQMKAKFQNKKLNFCLEYIEYWVLWYCGNILHRSVGCILFDIKSVPTDRTNKNKRKQNANLPANRLTIKRQ